MPRVPTYQRQVKTRAISGVKGNTNAPLEVFGGGNAKVLNAVSNNFEKVSDVYFQQKEKADRTRVDEATNTFLSYKSEKFNNKDTGYNSKQGKNAIGSVEDWDKDSQLKYDEISKDLNDNQKEMFKQKYFNEHLNGQERLNIHEGRQAKVYETEQAEAYIGNVQNDLATDYRNPISGLVDTKRVIQKVSEQNEKIIELSESNGDSKEVLDAKLLDNTSKNHTLIVSSIMNEGSDLEAKEYYEKSKHQLNARDKQNIEKALELSSTKGESQRLTDNIMNQGANLGESLAMARENKDPKIRDLVTQRIKKRFSEDKAALQYAEDDIMDDSYNQLNDGKSYDELDPSIISALPADKQEKIKKWAFRDTDFKTNLKAYYQIEQMAANDPEAFKKMDLWNHREQLDDSDFKKFSGLKRSMQGRGGDKGSSQLLQGIESKTSIVNNALKKMDIDYNKGDEDEIESSNKFRKKVDEAVIEFQENNNRKIGTQELRQITEDLQVELVTSKNTFWFDSKKKLFELTPGDNPVIDIDDIPEDEIAKIKEALKRRGLESNNEEITRLFSMKMNKRLGKNVN